MLNKNGWGFRAFLISGAVLFVALLVTAFLVMRLYSGLPDLSSFLSEPLSYQEIENRLDDSSLIYIREHYDQEITTGVIVVSTDNLLKYDVIVEKDLKETNNNDLCSGYSLIRKENEELTSQSFIKCDNYVTEGYQSWRVSK